MRTTTRFDTRLDAILRHLETQTRGVEDEPIADLVKRLAKKDPDGFDSSDFALLLLGESSDGRLTKVSELGTVGNVLAAVTEHRDTIVARASASLSQWCGTVVQPALSDHVASHVRLTSRWPFPWDFEDGPVMWLRLLMGAFGVPAGERTGLFWPDDATPGDVVDWLARVLQGTWNKTKFDQLRAAVKSETLRGKVWPGPPSPLPLGYLALIYCVERDLERFAPAAAPTVYAHDAQKVSYRTKATLAGVNPRKSVAKREFQKGGQDNDVCVVDVAFQEDAVGRARGKLYQMQLPYGAASGNFHRVLRSWYGEDVVRDYALVEFTMGAQRARANEAVWMFLGEALELAGLGDTPKTRAALKTSLRRLHHTELQVSYGPGQSVRAPIVAVVGETNHGVLLVKLHPALYEGVRGEGAGGGMSQHGYWFPQPVRALSIPANTNGSHAHTMRSYLVVRWRKTMFKPGGPVCVASVETLAECAGVSPDASPGRRAKAVISALDTLTDYGVTTVRYVRGEAGSLAAVLEVRPANYNGAADQLSRIPVIPMTGDQLRELLRSQGLDQAAAANLLGVSVDAIKRGVRMGATAISPKLRAALKQYLWVSLSEGPGAESIP